MPSGAPIVRVLTGIKFWVFESIFVCLSILVSPIHPFVIKIFIPSCTAILTLWTQGICRNTSAVKKNLSTQIKRFRQTRNLLTDILLTNILLIVEFIDCRCFVGTLRPIDDILKLRLVNCIRETLCLQTKPAALSVGGASLACLWCDAAPRIEL